MAYEMRCFRRILGITRKQKTTNETVMQRIKGLIGENEPLIEVVRRRRLPWFGHVTRRPGTPAHTIMHGEVEGKKNRGRPRHTWLADIRKWTGHSIIKNVREAEKRGDLRKRVMTSNCPNGCQPTGITWTSGDVWTSVFRYRTLNFSQELKFLRKGTCHFNISIFCSEYDIWRHFLFFFFLSNWTQG